MEKNDQLNSDPLSEVEEDASSIQQNTNEVKITPKSTQFRLAPSTIGHYFHLSCDRFLAFKTSGIDSIRWCYKDVDVWKTYTREESVWIEMAYLNNEKKITLSNDRTIVFNDLTETKKSKDQDPADAKPIRRGVWFLENEQKNLVPLPDNLVAEIEDAKKNAEKLDKLAEEFKTVEGLTMKINIKDSIATIKKEEDKLVQLKLQRGLSGEDEVKDVIGKAYIDSGELWEETIVQKILPSKGHQVFTATSEDQLELKLSAQKIDYQEFISILKTFKYEPIEGKRYFIYQPTVIIPQEFYEKFNVPSYKVTFSNCYPDFMELKCTENGQVELTVVDAKASPKMKLSHRIQVAMYALYLEEVFKKENITNIVVSNNGGVWIRPNEDYTLFDLTPVKHVLQEFLNCNNMDSKLRLILNTALHEVPYHLNKRCSGCPYLPICEAQSNNSLDLSLVKGITRQRKQFMVDFLQKLDQSGIKKAKKYPTANSMEKKSIKRLKVYDIEDCHQLLGELFPTSPASFLDVKPKEKPKKRTPTKAKVGASEPNTPVKSEANQADPQTPVKTTGTDPAVPATPSTPKNSNTNVPLSPTTPFELRETIGSATNAQVWMTRKEKPTDVVNYENLPQSVKLELWDLKCKVDAWMAKDIMFYNTAAPTMTCESDISVVINVISDPPSGSISGWFVHFSVTTKSFVKEGLLNLLAEQVLALNDLSFVENVKIDGTNSIFIYDMATQPSPPDSQAVLLLESRLVKALHACLSVLSIYNTNYRNEEEKKGKKPSEINKKLIKTQFFTFDSSEYLTLKNILFRTTSRDKLEDMANNLILTLINSTDVLFNDKQPDFDSTPEYPIIVLKKEIDSIVSVPLPFNAEFSEYVASFGGDQEPALNSKEILAAWYSGFPVKEISALYRKRAETLQSLVFAFEKTIEERNPLVMPRATPPFFMRSAMDFQHPLLSKLAFVVKFEQYIAGAKRSNTRSSLLTTMMDKTLVADRVLIVKLHEDEKKAKTEVPIINAPVPVEIPEDLSSSKSPTAKVLRPRSRSTKLDSDELNSDPAPSQDSTEVKAEIVVEPPKEKVEEPVVEAQKPESEAPLDDAKLEESWKELQVIFPDKDVSELKALLIANQGQLQLVVESLLGEKGPGPEALVPQADQSDEKTPVKAAPKKRAAAGSAKKKTPASRAKKSTLSSDETSEDKPVEDKNNWVRFDVVDFSENLRIEVDRAIGTYNWLIARVDERGVKDLLKYNDFVNREKWGPAFGTTVAFAKIENIDERNKTIGINAKFQAYASGVFSPDYHYIMTERHADLLSKYVLETLKEVDLIDELQKVLKPYLEDRQFIMWLETACFELSQLPKKDKATLLVPAEFKAQMTLLEAPLKFTLAKGKKKSEDDDDASAVRFASLLPDAAMHFRVIYLAIQELQGIITTSGLYLQLLEDPISWGRNSPEGKEAIDSPSSKKALQLVQEVLGGLFTEAQAKVFEQVVQKKLQLIWGPPGTGKTHFLATTVVLLAEAHRFAQTSSVEKPTVDALSTQVVAPEKRVQVDPVPVEKVTEPKPEEVKAEPEVKKDEPVMEKAVEHKQEVANVEEKKDEPATEKDENKEVQLKFIDTSSKLGHGRFQTAEEKNKVKDAPVQEKKDEPVPEKTEEKKDEPAQAIAIPETNDQSEPKPAEVKPKPASAKGRKPKAAAVEENQPAKVGEGQEFKVLVVGFTHSSIDNLINKILEMVGEFDKVKKDKTVDFKLPVARLVKRDADTSDMPESANFELLKAENAATVLKWLNNNVQCVLGGTVWAVRKVFKERFNQPPRFHMVIVDEASQMLLSDAYHPLRYLLKDEGRLILAGDDQQLPPIINGEYPELPPSEPVLFSSIFNAFRHKDVKQECTSMLIENWRMNESLVELPSTTIYKTNDPKLRYHAANEKIATQSFPLKKLKDDQFYYTSKGVEATETVSHPLLRLFLDGESPLVVVLLKVDTYSEIGNFPHSDLIAAFTSAIRKTFNKAEGTSEDNLWREKLHIVAPHHIQRQAIFNSIYGSKKWNQEWHKEAEPFIETVEKTQGREVDCTIVDYGLLNTSQIKNELRFIYSRPRLNVSLTRAKKKCVVVVSDILLSAAIEHIFDSKETERGFTHFQNLIDYAKAKNSLYNLALSELPETIAELQKDPFFKN